MARTAREGVFFGYVAAVGALGLALAAPSLAGLPAFTRHAPTGFWLLVALAVFVDSGPFGRLRPSPCFGLAALLGWGVAPAVLVQAAAVGAASLWLPRRPWRGAFDTGRYALAFVAAYAARPHGGVLLAAGTWFLVDRALVVGAGWVRGRRYPSDDPLVTAALVGLGALLAGAGYLIPLVLVPLYAIGRMAGLSRERDRHRRLDPLTGLLTRQALAGEVDRRAREGERFALLLIDLDRFRQITAALGHDAGDRLLTAVGWRLAGVPGTALARLGADEFALLGAGRGEEATAGVAQALTEPVVLDDLPVEVAGTVGVAAYPDHGTDAGTLLRHAELALHEARERGEAVGVYLPGRYPDPRDRLRLLADLRRALAEPDRWGIAFAYQPQVALASGAVIGVEALLRWRHPDRGPVDPAELIRAAEHSPVMRLLTQRVVDDVVAQLGRWAADGVRVRASINVSVRDLHTPAVADRLAVRLSEHGVGADQVQLEITEGALMADARRVLATLERLDALGVALSLDDFGTGYSSMRHLRRLPLTEVKIDRSFVLGMAGNPGDEAVVRSIVGLARALGLRVVAEGVEDERTLRRLAVLGCDAVQGWYTGRPMPAAEVPHWLDSRARSRAG